MSQTESEGSEERFVSCVRGMLARPDYLIPLAAAERQFRDHYYGLNSAALLEDLFYDAVGNYLRQVQPTLALTRPATGQKGWDYAFSGLQISHKVQQGVGKIAALWDATKPGVTSWSFDQPIVYVLGNHQPSSAIELEVNGETTKWRAVSSLPRPYDVAGRAVVIVRWPSDSSAPALIANVATEAAGTMAEVLPFDDLWKILAEQISDGLAANEIDVLVSTRKLKPGERSLLASTQPRDPINLTVPHRAGVYLFERRELQNLDVTTNNRAILIPTNRVRRLLQNAATSGLFAALPTWYWPYAEDRPPDMYSSQRAEYDARFSARGSHDSSGSAP